MPEAIQVTRYRTFDGKDFASESEAEAHERANFACLMVDLSLDNIKAAIAREPGSEALGDAIERAAYLISKARLAAGDRKRTPKAPESAPTPAPEPETTETQEEAA